MSACRVSACSRSACLGSARRFLVRAPLFLSFLAACSLLFACSSSDKEDAPKEISEQKSSSGVSLDTPEAELFAEAKRMYQAHMYSIARENFEAIRTGYPVGPYAEFSDLKIADCDFESGEYETAAQGYEDFVKNHPASRSVPYAIYRAARSHQLASRGVGRDPAPLENALKWYNRLLAEYPTSYYSIAAAEYQKDVTEQLGAHEKKIIDFYKKREKEGAVGARSALYSSTWDPKIESSRNIATAAEEERKAAMLAESDSLEKGAPAATPKLEENAPGLKVGGETERAEQPSAPLAAPLAVLDVRCDNTGSGKIFIQLNRAPVKDFAAEPVTLAASNGKLTFAMPEPVSPAGDRDCLADKDLAIGADGTISLKTDRAGGSATYLAHPDRLLIVLD